MESKTSPLTYEKIIRALKTHRGILKKYHVKRIGLFGSYAKGKQSFRSDVDFLVEFKKPGFDDFMELAFFLEAKLKRKVDLITNGSLSPYIRPYVEKEVKWYEA